MALQGVDELASAADGLRSAADGLGQLESVDQAAAQLVDTASRPDIPVASGRLAGAQTVAGGVVSNATPYALPVHAGWRRGRASAPAHPWLVRGADKATPDVLDLYADHVDQQLARVT